MSRQFIGKVARAPVHYPKSKYPENIRVTFRTPEGTEVNVNCKDIPSALSKYLMSLLPGEFVPLEEHKNALHEKNKEIPPFYYGVAAWGVVEQLMAKLNEVSKSIGFGTL